MVGTPFNASLSCACYFPSLFHDQRVPFPFSPRSFYGFPAAILGRADQPPLPRLRLSLCLFFFRHGGMVQDASGFFLLFFVGRLFLRNTWRLLSSVPYAFLLGFTATILLFLRVRSVTVARRLFFFCPFTLASGFLRQFFHGVLSSPALRFRLSVPCGRRRQSLVGRKGRIS